ncbi:MAG TPA: hypothetical protein VFW92_10555 [Candidatus Limnocylindrales bacterium]|nr:hypothetical protein [Candidatus Limnocylindrales bacterium]
MTEYLRTLAGGGAEVARLEAQQERIQRRIKHYTADWDAAIIEASRALGCGVVLSEDLDAGTDDAGVRVENPFDHP